MRAASRVDVEPPLGSQHSGLCWAAFLVGLLCGSAAWAKLEVNELTLSNGMTVLVVPQAQAPMVAAGWVVAAGSASESKGRTGVAHLLEHLMFNGTQKIGTRDFDRERELMRERERLEAAIAGDRARTAQRRRLASVERELKQLRIDGEFARVYAEAGAVGIDARTSRDFSIYSMMVPPERLELWFWMESDRLLQPVFRDIAEELSVIAEEERQRVGSTPLGPVLERWEEFFWGEDDPYSWLSGGRAADWSAITRSDLRAAFEQMYAPANLTAAIVGPVDLELVGELAERYFGRLPRRRPAAPTAVASAPPEVAATRTIAASCACRSQIELRFRTVPFASDDATVLDVLAGILNGRTGRLRRGLVLESGIALAAAARHSALRRSGWFSLSAQARDGVSHDVLSAALLAELEALRLNGVGERELQKVKNQITTDAARQLRRPLSLSLRLLTYHGLGAWRRVENWQQQALAVTPAAIARVLDRYFEPASRAELRVASDASAAMP